MGILDTGCLGRRRRIDISNCHDSRCYANGAVPQGSYCRVYLLRRPISGDMDVFANRRNWGIHRSSLLWVTGHMDRFQATLAATWIERSLPTTIIRLSNPAREYRINNVLVNRLMHWIAFRICRLNVFNGGVTLRSICKRHDEKILMITLFIRIHNRMLAAFRNRPGLNDQAFCDHQFGKCVQRNFKFLNVGALSEIKARMHMQH